MIVYGIIFYSLFAGVLPTPAVYDQRQYGDTNVRVDMKDVVVAVLDGNIFADYDYNYDYSDLTIKPETGPSSTTRKPTTSSTTTTLIIPTSLNESTTNENITSVENTELNLNSSQTEENVTKLESTASVENKPPKALPEQEFQIPVFVVHDRLNDKNLEGQDKNPDKTNSNKRYVSSALIRRKTSDNLDLTNPDQPSRNCSPGFFLDSQNRCKKIRRHALLQRERPKLPFGLRFPQLTTGQKPS